MKKTLQYGLFLLMAWHVSAQADLVGDLRSSGLCREALKSSNEEVLKGRNASHINCLTLQGYFQTIDSDRNHRSFARARALVNAQRILDGLAHAFREVGGLQDSLDRAFEQNLRALGELKMHSVLQALGQPKQADEIVFFLGVQRQGDNLYVLEGRKILRGPADFAEQVLEPDFAAGAEAAHELTLKVGNARGEYRYLPLHEIRSMGRAQAVGFYIKSMGIEIPVPGTFRSFDDVDLLGRELAALLGVRASASSRGDNRRAWAGSGGGVMLEPGSSYRPDDTDYSSPYSSPSSPQTCENFHHNRGDLAKVGSRGTRFRQRPDLTEGDTPPLLRAGTEIHALKTNSGEYLIKESKKHRWLCVYSGKHAGNGWVFEGNIEIQ